MERGREKRAGPREASARRTALLLFALPRTGLTCLAANYTWACKGRGRRLSRSCLARVFLIDPGLAILRYAVECRFLQLALQISQDCQLKFQFLRLIPVLAFREEQTMVKTCWAALTPFSAYGRCKFSKEEDTQRCVLIAFVLAIHSLVLCHTSGSHI